ncbi:unnamed protein product [Ambrosiozyma monospora]|uniref:Unnamed protein product n=1 Tax=Ambrosiozyma monospora TaxID=43982 RepID=A0A9W6T8P5_AMBMO|nr:unnamed protein product [Ambrosiozyma monospora]
MARSRSPTKRTRSKSPTKQRLPVMLSRPAELPPLVSPVLNYFTNLSLQDRDHAMASQDHVEKLRKQTSAQIIAGTDPQELSNIRTAGETNELNRRKGRGPRTEIDNAQKRAHLLDLYCSGKYHNYSHAGLAGIIHSNKSTVQSWIQQFKNGKSVANNTGRHKLPPLPLNELGLIAQIYHIELERKGEYPTTNFLLTEFQKRATAKGSKSGNIGLRRFERNLKYLSLKTFKDKKDEQAEAQERERENNMGYDRELVQAAVKKWYEDMFFSEIEYQKNCLFIGRLRVSKDFKLIEMDKDIPSGVDFGFEFAIAFMNDGFFAYQIRLPCDDPVIKKLFKERKQAMTKNFGRHELLF